MPSARHLRSAGKWVLITVYSRPGIEAMDAAGVLPAFAGIACLDAWAPCDTYRNVAGHASRNAHLLRELTAVTETGTRAQRGRRREQPHRPRLTRPALPVL